MSAPDPARYSPIERWVDAAIARQMPEPGAAFSLQDAAHLALFAQQEADACGVPIVFSLVDGSGRQRYFFSMDHALLVSHTLAFQKAYSAVALKMPTHELAALVQPGAVLYGLPHLADICCIGGGLPLWAQGRLIGGIGISGGTVEQDLTIARNVLRRFSTTYFSLIA
ncbi:ATP:cob(I)alamin adenosyltransferase [Gibbsiella quercinecans]|uniref:Cobalamin adenosyltransferase n=1 Tax=Gibbsiella quercinecans TaxID=929813 RepID=A0A250B653_9GAMM|nr:heme-binding protein [Gibbsiella quercinecans]ATA21556.1 hypothetical protein AWC35_20625 [Gibbsiella quercinecans]RLM05283.1 hypothetical protein BIY30_18770 [Gibbsiella quercinecans]RLM05802.1 hypothetical protein BIY31_16505 [Gibbsiella quercinecans]TCT82980.1 ATP:cob(I)alamin adenosyltransferase [Gibbsiella quercinecans]